ncbi:putative RNA-directed DNA polymerase from transposon X-element [Trichonephila clavipes]|nr:putative RNA-directed DNA polymerase from transposon X-element [Trichonephila clavipes]
MNFTCGRSVNDPSTSYKYYLTPYGERIVSLLQVYQSLILSRLDYGCVVYGSARASVLKRLDTVHDCSGAFRTSPVTSLYVENNILAFPPWDIQIFNLSNPFSGFEKPGTAAIIYQQLFSYHRNKFSKYIPVYTNGSKTVGHVGCGVVFNNTIFSFSLHSSMSVFSAELTAILIALQHILVSNHRHFCVYTDSMSTRESLRFLTECRHPTVIEILILLRKLERKGFDIIFSWVPGHVGILGNEQADTAARSMSDHMQRPVCYQDLKTFTQNYIHRVWQETWDQQILNKLHSIHPYTSHWAALPVRRHDVRLTQLRIGHTCFTHRHLLLGESAPECPSCKVPYSVYHILIDCPVFNRHRVTFFHTSVLTLSDLIDVEVRKLTFKVYGKQYQQFHDLDEQKTAFLLSRAELAEGRSLWSNQPQASAVLTGNELPIVVFTELMISRWDWLDNFFDQLSGLIFDPFL